jgi:class 3 adenylate cyclase
MDLGGWLRGLGLAQYEAAFRDNEIDEAVLQHQTAEDLEELGVGSVGHRRKLLAAIAALGTPAPSEAVPTPSPASAPTKAREVSAERRPITAMFCDLVGSTGLAAKLDAEDWRNLVSAYLDEASAAVTGLGGHVPKGARTLTPFVGREEDLARLLRRWERADRGWATHTDRRRAGLRKIAAPGRISSQARRDAAHLGRMERLAAFAEHPAAPDHRMGAAKVRDRHARRAAARRSRSLARTGQARSWRIRPVAGPAPRHPAAAGTRREPRAGGDAEEAAGRAPGLDHRRRARSQSCSRSRTFSGRTRPGSTSCGR